MMSRNFAIYLCSGVLFLALIDQCIAVQCYKCHVTPTYIAEKNITTPLCRNFDYSHDFVTECPYSTMCQKKIIKLELNNKEIIETYTRGCANQRYTDEFFRDGRWQREYKVDEPYEEECKEFTEDILSASTSTYCYCRGNLCNSAPSKEASGLHTDAMAVIFVFNVMKFLRSGNAH